MADPAYIVNGTLTDGEAWVAVGSAEPVSAQVTFTSTDDGQVGDFSQYMDLVIISYCRSAASGTWKDIYINFNNDTGANYTAQDLFGSGYVAAQRRNPSATGLGYIPGSDATANVFASVIHTIFDINSGKYKAVTTECAAMGGNPDIIWLETSNWVNQAAITEIDVNITGTWAAGSRCDLFGILPRMVS